MPNYTKINKTWWNHITPLHAQSKLYNLKEFKKGKTSLQETEIQEVGNVQGKTMLHLMCHFGMDSISWARKGALVTGIDISETAITLAKKLADEEKIPATFICADVYALPKILKKKFDIVFMSYGILLWLSDIKKFFHIVSYFLKKGGTLYIVDLHPFTNILSFDTKMAYDYFDKGPFLDDANGTYTDWNKKSVKGITYEWSYTVADMLTAAIQEKLHIEFFHEFPFTMYNQFPGYMKQTKDKKFVLKNKKVQFPLLFSLKVKK